MEKPPRPLKGTEAEKALYIIRTLQKKGHVAYFAGGCVRDMVMNREPTDYDIATTATPDDVMQTFPKWVPVGKRFGVILVVFERSTFEVSTFRSEGPYLDGRHPSKVR